MDMYKAILHGDALPQVGGHVPHASETRKLIGGCFSMPSFWGNSGKHKKGVSLCRGLLRHSLLTYEFWVPPTILMSFLKFNIEENTHTKKSLK
jgi:hypothetical protein